MTEVLLLVLVGALITLAPLGVFVLVGLLCDWLEDR